MRSLCSCPSTRECLGVCWHLSNCWHQPWGSLSTPASTTFPLSFCTGQRQVLASAWQSCMTNHIKTPSGCWIWEQINAGGGISALLSSKVTRRRARKKHARKYIGTSSNNVPTAFAYYWHQISANQRMTLWIGLYRGPKAAREATKSQRWFLLPQTCYGFQPPSPTD